jgi:hypothetical protein
VGEWILVRDRRARLKLRSRDVTPPWVVVLCAGIGVTQIGAGFILARGNAGVGAVFEAFTFLALLLPTGTLFLFVARQLASRRRYHDFDGRRGRLRHEDSLLPHASLEAPLRRLASVTLAQSPRGFNLDLSFDGGRVVQIGLGDEPTAAQYLYGRVRSFFERREDFPDLPMPEVAAPAPPRGLTIGVRPHEVRYSWRLLRIGTPAGAILSLFFLVFASGIPIALIAVVNLLSGSGQRERDIAFALGGGVMSLGAVLMAATVAQPLFGRGEIRLTREALDCRVRRGLRPYGPGTHRFPRNEVESADVRVGEGGSAFLVIEAKGGRRAELPFPIGEGHFELMDLYWIAGQIGFWAQAGGPSRKG